MHSIATCLEPSCKLLMQGYVRSCAQLSQFDAVDDGAHGLKEGISVMRNSDGVGG